MAATRGAVRLYARQLNDTNWLTVLGYAWALFITVALLVIVTPEAWRAPVKALRLREDAPCAITHHGVERSGVRYVFLYLDRPEQLLRALAA